MRSSQSTPTHRSNGARALGLLALASLLACGAPEDTSTPEPRRGRQTDDAAEWAAARRSDDAEIADGAPLDDDAPVDQAAGAGRFPCTVADQQEIEGLLGNAVEAPSWTLEEVADEGTTYDAETCSWLSFADDASEIILQVSRAEHFADGRVRCWTPVAENPEDSAQSADEDGGEDADVTGTATAEVEEDIEPAPTPVAVADLGSTAWWTYDPATAFGQLQVCHPNGRIAVEVSASDGGAARRAGVTVARRALEGP